MGCIVPPNSCAPGTRDYGLIWQRGLGDVVKLRCGLVGSHAGKFGQRRQREEGTVTAEAETGGTRWSALRGLQEPPGAEVRHSVPAGLQTHCQRRSGHSLPPAGLPSLAKAGAPQTGLLPADKLRLRITITARNAPRRLPGHSTLPSLAALLGRPHTTSSPTRPRPSSLDFPQTHRFCLAVITALQSLC